MKSTFKLRGPELFNASPTPWETWKSVFRLSKVGWMNTLHGLPKINGSQVPGKTNYKLQLFNPPEGWHQMEVKYLPLSVGSKPSKSSFLSYLN